VRGCRDFSEIIEALDRVQYHVVIYFNQVYRTVARLNPPEMTHDRKFIIPAMMAEDLGLHVISEAIDQYVSSASATLRIAVEAWDRNKLLRTTALSGLDPISVYHWAQAAKAHVSRFVPDLDQGARIYLTIEAQRDAIVAMEGATVINRTTIDSCSDWLSAPTLSLETRRRLLGTGGKASLFPADTPLQHFDAQPTWEFVRPRVKALGETIDAPRPAHFLTSKIFGIRPPERALVKTAIEEVLDITPSSTKEFVSYIERSLPPLTPGAYRPKRLFPGFVFKASEPTEQNKPATPDVLETRPSLLEAYELSKFASFETDHLNLSIAESTVPLRQRIFPTLLPKHKTPKLPLFEFDNLEPDGKLKHPATDSSLNVPTFAHSKLREFAPSFPSLLEDPFSLDDPLQPVSWKHRVKGISKK
jgi:hypothetical protein